MVRLYYLLYIVFLSSIPAAQGNRGESRLPHKMLRVTTVLMEPYMMFSEEHANTTGNIKFYGYLADLLLKVSQMVGFNYKIHVVPDKSFGYRHRNGYWDGMIGEVSSGRADLAAGPLFITPHRNRVVDFTVGYMSVTATVLLRRPPTGTRLKIRSADDLINQDEIKYGSLNKGVIKRAFKYTNESTYRFMWRKMQRFEPSVLTHTNEMGIERVRNEKYAFIIPSTIGEYISLKYPCDLVTVDNFLMKMEYGLALSKGSFLLPEINRAISGLKRTGYLDSLYRRWWFEKADCGHGQNGNLYSAFTSGQEKRLHSFITTYVLIHVVIRQVL